MSFLNKIQKPAGTTPTVATAKPNPFARPNPFEFKRGDCCLFATCQN
jgi:hypothetical protein